MADTLKEYLISLGFRVDDTSLRAFNARITQAGANVAQLGFTSIAAATAIGVAVEKTAKLYEELYYVSQRTGSSVSALKSYEFGAKQIGLSSEQARSSVEGLAAAIRTNPGIGGLLRKQGIDPNNAQQAVISITEMLKKQYGPNGYFIASKIAEGLYGQSETTFKQTWDNLDKLKAEAAASRERQKAAGVDSDDLAKKSLAYSNSLNVVIDKLGLVKDRIGADFMPAATSVLDVTSKIIDSFNGANESTSGWTGIILGLVSALTAARIALVPLLSMLGMGGAAGVATRVLGLGGLLGVGGLKLAASTALGAGGAVMGVVAANAIKNDANTGNSLRTSLRSALGIQDPGELSKYAGVSGKRDAAVKFFVDNGWTREQAIGIAANFASESQLDPRAFNGAGGGQGAHGLGQWRGKRLEDFKRVMGKDIKESTFEEQLAFTQWELQNTEKGAGNKLRDSRTSRDAAVAFSSGFERHMNPAEDARRGDLAKRWDDTVLKSDTSNSNVTIAPVTHTTITGVSDPKKAADLVGTENSRQLGNITRWGRGVIDNGAVPQN